MGWGWSQGFEREIELRIGDKDVVEDGDKDLVEDGNEDWS